MIISMKMHATRQEIDEVRAQVAHFGYKVHSIEGEERVVIGVVGVGDVTACLESVESMPQVEKVVRIPRHTNSSASNSSLDARASASTGSKSAATNSS